MGYSQRGTLPVAECQSEERQPLFRISSRVNRVMQLLHDVPLLDLSNISGVRIRQHDPFEKGSYCSMRTPAMASFFFPKRNFLSRDICIGPHG